MANNEDKMTIRFKVWFDDGAITPMGVVNATNYDEDCDDFEHPFTGPIEASVTQGDIIKIAAQHDVEAYEIEFDV